MPIILARLGGADLLGEFVTLINLAALFIFLAAFGLPMLLTREISRCRDDREQIDQLISASLGLVLAFSLLSILLMWGLSYPMGYTPLMQNALLLTGVALAFESLANVLAASFRGIEKMEWSSAVAFVTELIFLILALIIVPRAERIDWLMAALVVSRIISLFVAIWIYTRRFGRPGLSFDLSLWKHLLKTGFPFAMNEVVTLFQGRIGFIILSFFAGNVMVGLFEVVVSLTLRINILGRAINDSLYPFLSSQFLTDARILRVYTAKTIHFLSILGFFIVTMLWIFGKDLLSALYGPEFVEAVPALRLLALLIPVRFMTNSLAVALTASNRQAKRTTAVTVAASTNLILNLILIPSYQMMGAVYAIIFMEAVYLGMVLYYLRFEAKEIIKWRALIAPILGSLLIGWGSLLFNPQNIWVSVVGYSSLYLLIILTFNRPDLETLRLLTMRKRI